MLLPTLDHQASLPISSSSQPCEGGNQKSRWNSTLYILFQGPASALLGQAYLTLGLDSLPEIGQTFQDHDHQTWSIRSIQSYEFNGARHTPGTEIQPFPYAGIQICNCEPA